MQLPPFRLERYFAKYEFTTEFLLSSSDCEAMTIAELLALEEGSQAKFQETWLGYTDSRGSLPLREAISALYQAIEPENVLVHTGAEEAIFLFMHALLRPEDHVIVHWPCYQSLLQVASSIGCELSLWVANEENEWALDLKALRALIRPETRLIVINTPHNPTGFLMPAADFRALGEIANEHHITLFSDEVYRGSEYEAAAQLPAACDLAESAVSLGVTSKTYGLAGLRIGWIATRDRELIGRMAGLKDYTSICNSAPSEYLAALALRQRNKLVDRNLDIIKSNLDVMEGFFARHSDQFRWVRPRAGSMAYPHLIQGDVDGFCDRLVHTAGVLLVPGSVYADETAHFRLGLGRKNLPKAIERLESFLDLDSA